MTRENISELHHLLNRAMTIACTDSKTPKALTQKIAAARTTLIQHRKEEYGE